VEDVLLGHPAVVQAHVVPLPHDRMGEVGVGFVVLDEEVPVTPSALVEWCGERLARFKVPAHVVPVPAGDLPTSATGKVQKFLLAEWAKQLLTV
jgi:fatty-acyl-CoA synthase